VLAATGAAIAVGLVLPFSMLAGPTGMTPLPALYFGFLAFILLGYCAVLQIAKNRFAATS
jgi:Mg2+-importing ATPase